MIDELRRAVREVEVAEKTNNPDKMVQVLELSRIMCNHAQDILAVLENAKVTAMLATSTGYRGLGVLRLQLSVAKLEGAAMGDQFVDFIELYRDVKQGWRWRAKSNNGQIVADSSEAYVNRDDAEEAAKEIFPNNEIRTFDEAPA